MPASRRPSGFRRGSRPLQAVSAVRFGRGHETPFSEVGVVALGVSGVGTICQLVPFQRSATVASRKGSLPFAWNNA